MSWKSFSRIWTGAFHRLNSCWVPLPHHPKVHWMPVEVCLCVCVMQRSHQWPTSTQGVAGRFLLSVPDPAQTHKAEHLNYLLCPRSLQIASLYGVLHGGTNLSGSYCGCGRCGISPHDNTFSDAVKGWG